ncbi:two-component system OmpR family sensor kinase [Nocardioides sp. BE266]|uniref:sensor histidine kinase n=1 Tax=Nocardioides sp. BE266 TaxID=2817725 RepID=UPI0028600817|nr:HAMP domain-containing sensor histidine kinase [Nocardioides sp. BE266]MDR7252338.1 two-component system OmpR family sensor kinase [Nocardioides sp. BE266]
MRRRLASLTSRLVLTAVALVVAVSILIAVAATLAMNNRLTEQVDGQLEEVTAQLPFLLRTFNGHDDGPAPRTRPGTVVAGFPSDTTAADAFAYKLNVGRDDNQALGASARDALEAVPVDGKVHDVRLPGLGEYRVRAVTATDGVAVVGLPTSDVDDAVGSLIGYEAVLILMGAALAAGGGLLLVRRQLAPLREVAATAHRVSELPLASGDIEIAERVPERLTDEGTEVGQVGSALNSMLDHVEASLAQRHRSEQQVRQFVADASHELRTPLATIAGYTELARKRPETSGTALDKVETESARMTGLVEDLLLLARLDAGRPLERKTVDLSRLLLEAVDDARVVDRERSWRLALPDEPLVVAGDEARLHQVVSNLLTNARKHTPAGSTVTVTGTAEGFTVHDDGPGFSPELAPRAFERFTRGDAARTRGGAGLGLSLVEAIVAAHGGSVDLTSGPGDTTITVRLPGADPSPEV